MVMLLNKVLDSSEFVVDRAKHVGIDYDKISGLTADLSEFKYVHYLTKVRYPVYEMGIRNLVNFLLIFDAINFSFWGEPKWTIETDGKILDGGMALLHCVFSLFDDYNGPEIFRKIEKLTFGEFGRLLRGNVEIPLLKERYEIATGIARIVNEKMSGDFFECIRSMTCDQEIFEVLLDNFGNFADTRQYAGQTVYFYKLAQLLTSDILQVMANKERKKVDRSHLLGCADYKIPQVLRSYGVLVYDEELSELIDSGAELVENSVYEVEIRASMLVVIDYMWKKINRKVDRIDINDFLWNRGQDKTRKMQPYHRTRTTAY